MVDELNAIYASSLGVERVWTSLVAVSARLIRQASVAALVNTRSVEAVEGILNRRATCSI